jgi:hypothetical protein
MAQKEDRGSHRKGGKDRQKTKKAFVVNAGFSSDPQLCDHSTTCVSTFELRGTTPKVAKQITLIVVWNITSRAILGK